MLDPGLWILDNSKKEKPLIISSIQRPVSSIGWVLVPWSIIKT